MTEKENLPSSSSGAVPEVTPSSQDDKKNKKPHKSTQSKQRCCCSNMACLPPIFAVSALKASAVLLCAASVLLSLFAVFMCLPAIQWMMRTALYGGGALSALFVMDDILLPPFALLMLYISLRVMRKIMAFVNSNPEVKQAEESFRFACCPKTEKGTEQATSNSESVQGSN